jgi:DNA modification methylase
MPDRKVMVKKANVSVNEKLEQFSFNPDLDDAPIRRSRARRIVSESLAPLKRKLQTSVLYCEDNLRQLAMLPAESVDLIYLDPPFFSNRHYEVIWGDEAEVRSFEDRWEGGINHYIEWLRDRVLEMWRVLKPTGSLYLHCDWHAGHYIKVMLDEVCGANHFQNEVVWWFRGGGVSKQRFARRHQTILFYTKSDTWTFNVDPVRTAYSPSVLESLPSRYDKSYRTNKVYSGYRPNPLGKHPDDVWPIQPLMPSDRKERLGYPTQKPEALLKVVVEASSNPGDVVLDPFAGCGTAVVVAERLKRRWIGIDISPTACNLMHRRLLKVGAEGVEVIGLPTTEDELRALKPFEFQNWVIQQLNGIQANRQRGDMGIDGWTFFLHDPVQIKQSEGVGRNVVDNFETAIERAGKKRGAIVAFSFGRGAREEVARVRKKGIEIHLLSVADLLDRLDWAMRQLGISDGKPDLKVAPLPQFDASRHSPEELIASAKSNASAAR